MRCLGIYESCSRLCSRKSTKRALTRVQAHTWLRSSRYVLSTVGDRHEQRGVALTVYKRGRSWALLVELGSGPNGQRRRYYRGGFPTKKSARDERHGSRSSRRPDDQCWQRGRVRGDGAWRISNRLPTHES
jgi:hypothetical protein